MAPRRGGTSIAEFQRHWREQHADAVRTMPGVLRYVQNHAVLDGGLPVFPWPGFDACAEMDFEDLAAMDRSFGSAEYAGAVRQDEAALIERSCFALLLGARQVLIDAVPPGTAVKLLTFIRFDPRSDPRAARAELEGPYADVVTKAGVLRHEQLIVHPQAHAGRLAPLCDLVDILWFANPEEAARFPLSAVGLDASAALAGHVFGAERLVARSVTVVVLARSP